METDSKPKVETPDVVFIDCDDEPTISEKNPNSKSHKKKRKVTLTEVDNLENIFITQNVHVKKQKIRCVINLNTNVCDSKRKLENRCSEESHRNEQQSIERIVPKCARSMCQSAISDILNNKNKCCKRTCQSIRRHRSKNKKSDKAKNHKDSKSSKRKHKKLKKRESKKYNRDPSLSLSSVSLSPFVSDITYEDISVGSFTCCSDEELDTLITRAKLREKRKCKTSELCSEKPLCASTPLNIIQLSSDEESLKSSESIHSLETFVLEPQLDLAYSPIHNSENIHSGCIEEYEKDNEIFILKKSFPTIDLTDTKSDSSDAKKPLKYFVNNNTNESKPKIVSFTDTNILNNLDHHALYLKRCEKLEPKAGSLKIPSKLLKPTECKPNVAKLSIMPVAKVEPPSVSSDYNNIQKIKTE